MQKSIFHLAQALTMWTLALVSPGAIAQNASETAANDVLVTVNGRPITQMSVDNVAKQILAEGEQADPQQILDELINLEVLTQAAEGSDLDKDPEISATLQLQYTQTMANAYLARKGSEMNFTEEQLRDEYESQSENADRAEYKASHILLETSEDAAAVLSQLAGGRAFDEAAAEYSIDATGASGGDLGWFLGKTMDPEFANAVATMTVGDISDDAVKTEFGYHIIQLVDKRDAALPPFDSVKSGLTNLAVRKALAEHVEELKASANIDTNP